MVQYYMLLLLILSVSSHEVAQVSSSTLTLRAYPHQLSSIDIPFQMCFKADYDRNFITFTPTTLSLQLSLQLVLPHSTIPSILMELRTPFIHRHRDILLFHKSKRILLYDDGIQWVKEQQNNTFKLINQYKIDEIAVNSNVRLYKMQEKGIAVVGTTIYVIDQDHYQQFHTSGSTITHIQHITQYQIVCSEVDKGITIYNLTNSTTLQITNHKYTANPYPKTFTLQFLPTIYILDYELGLLSLSAQQQPTILLHQRFCETFKFISKDEVVLVCQGQSHTMLIEAYRDKEQFITLPPLYYQSYLNNIHVSDHFYIGYSQRIIKIFWNTRKNNIPQETDTQSEIYLNGLQTLTVVNNTLYTVQSGILHKYNLKQKPPILTISSDVPVVKLLKVAIYGTCESSNGSNNGSSIIISTKSAGSVKSKTCKVVKDVLLTVVEMEGVKKEDFGISATIIVILIIMFLLIIWICLKKYKSLEREARRVLQNYQKKKQKKRFVI